MARKIIPYKPSLKKIARRLRKESTIAEVLLWKKLRDKQMLGFDFHRQKPIDRFIVDFFCNELRLAIEIDGSSHENVEGQKKDTGRQNSLESLGIRFLRFKESEVRRNIRGVLEIIEEWIKTYAK